MKKLFKITGTILVGIGVILAVLLVGVRLLGFQVYTVLSSSMEPAYKTGSLIYVRKTDPAAIGVGTPITFVLNGTTVATHRVIEVIPDENDPSMRCFRTKGDNNEVADGGVVHQNNVLGVPKFSFPYLGYAAHYIQTPPGEFIAIALGGAVLLLAFLPDLLGKGKGKESQQEAGGDV